MKQNLKPISNQCVVLFGATSGIGLETAMHMVEKEARVAIVGRNQEGLNEAVQRVREHAEASRMALGRSTNGNQYEMHVQFEGAPPAREMGQMGTSAPAVSTLPTIEEQVIGLEADVTNWDQVREVAEQVVQRFGRIDTWVNVAAVSEWALFEDTSPEEFKRVIDVNLVGHAYGAMAALPYMKQQMGGSLIFVSSIAGKVPVPYQSAYNASKHGILSLAETLRMETKYTGLPINVAVILPSSVNTPMFNKGRTKLGVEPEPIPPIYDTKLVARAIAYAATHPVRELIVGDSGYMMTFMRRLAPTLTSNYLGASGFRKQRSNEPKSAQAADNLFEHMSGYNQVEGEFSHQTKRYSPLTWLATHPHVRLGLMAASISGLGFLIGSKIIKARAQRRNRFSYRAKHFGQSVVTFLAALPIVSQLPIFQKRSLLQRAGDMIPFIGKPKSFKERIPLKKQRKAIADKIPTGKEMKRMVEKLPMVERRETLIEKMPFGERRESLVEKMPFRK